MNAAIFDRLHRSAIAVDQLVLRGDHPGRIFQELHSYRILCQRWNSPLMVHPYPGEDVRGNQILQFGIIAGIRRFLYGRFCHVPPYPRFFTDGGSSQAVGDIRAHRQPETEQPAYTAGLQGSSRVSLSA